MDAPQPSPDPATPLKKTSVLPLLKAAYGGRWLAPGGDPDLVLDAPIELGALRVAAPEEMYSVGTVHRTYPLNAEIFFCDLAAGLNPSQIRGVLPRDPQAQVSVMGAHEGVHALQNLVDFLDRALYWDRKEPSVGHSARFGHGPSLEANLERGEAPEERAARYRSLMKVTPDGTQRGRLCNVDAPEVYNLQQAEIQACLSQLIAPNERKWRKLPATPGEVVSAFYGFLLGNRPHPDFPIALHDVATSVAAEQLRNNTVESLRHGQQERFFARDLPAFYGDLMELRGDPQGRTKMGLEPGPVGARAFLWQMIREANDPETVPWSAEKWQRVAGKVEPYLAPRLKAIAGYFNLSAAQNALQPETEPSPERRHFLQTVGTALFHRVPHTAAVEGAGMVLAR